MIFGLVAIVLFFSGSVAMVAEKVLPESPLYKVKVHFNENLQSALSFSNESKARLDAKLIEERLAVAAQLAVQHKLTSDMSEKLEEHVALLGEDFKKRMEVVSESSLATSAQVYADFSSSLKAHSEVLMHIERVGSSDGAASLNDLLAKVNTLRVEISERRVEVEKKLAKKLESPEMEKVVEARMLVLEARLSEAETAFATSDELLTPELRNETEENLKKAQVSLRAGKALMEAGALVDAYSKFQNASSVAQEIIVAMHEYATLEELVSVLRPSVSSSTTTETMSSNGSGLMLSTSLRLDF